MKASFVVNQLNKTKQTGITGKNVNKNWRTSVNIVLFLISIKPNTYFNKDEQKGHSKYKALFVK